MVHDGIFYILPPVIAIPAGPFMMGSDLHKDPQASPDEYLHAVTLAAYEIGVYHVTVAEYALAVRAQAVPTPPDNHITWQAQQQRPEHPVVNISWLNILAYTQWLSQLSGQSWRVPSEAEWEKAARGTDGRIYPWGSQWDRTKANTHDGGPGDTTSVGTYVSKGDASPYGGHDMAGNAWQWTSSIYFDEAYKQDKKRENNSDTTSGRVMRGGTWLNPPRSARSAMRSFDDPTYADNYIGARVVRAPSLILS